MLSLLFFVAALLVAQIAVLFPVADFLTKKLDGTASVSPRGIPAAVHPAR
jgi:hypothetical protein